MGASSQTILSVQRAADLLALFARAGSRYLGVSEVARQMELSKATVHRLLVSLVDRDLMAFDEASERYALGPAALTLGMAYLDGVEVRTLAREPMQRLVAATGETATLAVRTGDERSYLDQLVPRREVKMTVELGRPASLHAGGASKAILASLEDAELDRYLATHVLERYTDRTITDEDALRREVGEIRTRGFAVSIMERELSSASVAAPVRDHEGALAAVLAVCGPMDRIEPSVERLAEPLLAEAGQLSQRLGHR